MLKFEYELEPSPYYEGMLAPVFKDYPHCERRWSQKYQVEITAKHLLLSILKEQIEYENRIPEPVSTYEAQGIQLTWRDELRIRLYNAMLEMSFEEIRDLNMSATSIREIFDFDKELDVDLCLKIIQQRNLPIKWKTVEI